MNEKKIKLILKDLLEGNLSINKVLSVLKKLPYKELGYAKVDLHRSLRGAHPETILAKGKSIDQIIGISMELIKYNENIMITKANSKIYKALKLICHDLKYHKKARIIILKPKKILLTNRKILIITAGTSDIRIAEEAAITAKTMGSSVERLYDVGVSGLHRLIDNYDKINSSTVLIVIAGMDGVLPSVVAGLTNKLVIAVPTSIGYGSNFSGLAPLLTMLNTCSNGVVTVNINNGYSAGYSAAIINKLTNNNGLECRPKKKGLRCY